jgi:hypothetical protein
MYCGVDGDVKSSGKTKDFWPLVDNITESLYDLANK